MAVHLVCAAVAAAGCVLGPGALGHVAGFEPGTYQISVPGGECLVGTGRQDTAPEVGECDGTHWKVEAVPGGYALRHADTGLCLAPSLLRIYPQRVAFRECGGLDDPWNVAGMGNGRVRISRPDYYSFLTWLSDREPVFLLPESQAGNQQWVFER